MNPKIAIVVDAKNRAISTVTGLATVGADVDVEVRGLDTGSVPDWAATDKFVGKSLRLRIVDELGHDLVRFPLVEKVTTPVASNGDTWTVDSSTETTPFFKTDSGVSGSPIVNFDTNLLRRAFHGVAFNETLEFGIILDSVVDKAEYATGRIKIRQWSHASTEDPTVLPDWRATLVELNTNLGLVEGYKTDAVNARNAAQTAQGLAVSAKESAQGSASSASTSASNAATSAANAATSASNAATSALLAADQVAKYPKIDMSVGGNKHWLVWNANKTPTAGFDDTGVLAEGKNGEDGTAATIAVGTVTTGAPGSGASVTNVGTSSAAVFNFTIPKGDTGSSGASTWNDITGKPTTFPPSSHTHADYAKMITTGSLGEDSSIDDIISKINTLIAQLKG